MGKSIADVLVHIDENLSQERLHEVESLIEAESGIVSACGRDDKPHLVVVTYDPDQIDSQTILHKVEAQGCHAELIGM